MRKISNAGKGLWVGIMNRPSVVITTPTYNREKLIRRSIDSVMAQTVDDWILIVADDGSTDSTPEIVASYDDKRIMYYPRKENKGLVYTFNEMLSLVVHMGCKYWSWLASDDELYPNFVERHLKHMEMSGADVTWSDFIASQGTKEKRIYMELDSRQIAATLRQRVCISLASICVSVDVLKEIYQEFGCFCSNEFKHMNDWDFLIKLAGMTEKFFYIREALARYYIHREMGSSGVYFGEVKSEAAKQFIVERARMIGKCITT